jgi:hypothetical protein
MEVTAQIELNREELWKLLESLPDNSSALYVKLSGLREVFEKPLPVYGNGSKIKPLLAAINDRINK